MIVYAYLLLLLEVISGQRLFFRGDRYGLSDYYNADLRTPAGVGVLKDFSNANILSHEPFIINFEFPKVAKSGDSRKPKPFSSKRSRRQRKKNRRLRRFRHIVLPESDLIERTKRFQFLQRHPNYEIRDTSLLVQEDKRRGKNMFHSFDNKTPLSISKSERFLKLENEETPVKPINDAHKNILQQIISPKLTEDNSVEETTEANSHKKWEDLKSKWMSLFSKDAEPEANNEMDEEEEKLKRKSHKMWANCQLLKLLKAPQRNPLFYKLLPSNYPALIMNEEKQLQCNKVYDIIDLSRDKKMIADKIEQLEKILSSEFRHDSKVSDMIPSKPEEAPQMRRKRDVEVVEKVHEPENTLQDETLQGKSEGDGRSDRSSRTKKRQRIRDREQGTNKDKRRRQKGAQKPKQAAHKNEHELKHHNRNRNSRMAAEPSQITTNDISKITKLDEKELAIKPNDDHTEQKREKLEIKNENVLQDVFKPSEVSKVIKQKELEANIFDKVVRTMKKFEENNPYDESFKPQKRESGNETEVVTADSGESILEVDDAVKKLAKIFKILGVRAQAKKCENCDSSEELASEEEDDKKTKKLKMTRQGKKCVCGEDCPLCQDCLKCFRECKKNAVASRNIIWSKQAPANALPYAAEYSGPMTDKKEEILNEEEKDNTVRLQEETAADRGNLAKVERMPRNKLPSLRDHVRLYFDNPQNKLLVWTKRGRRTMSWGPLTSDLQLYRDRARRILKSAEDILQRIKDTEEKIHASEYSENDSDTLPDKNGNIIEEKKKEKVMDDIIKKVVNEDATKSILRMPWVAELNKTQNSLDKLEKETMEMKENPENEESVYRIEGDNVAEPESENQLKPDKNVELGSTTPEKELEIVKEKDDSADSENRSVEAAVESIERQDNFEKVANDEVQGIRTDADEVEEKRKSEETEDNEYEDFPAKVEPIKNKDVFPEEIKDERLEKTQDRSEEEDEEEDSKLENTYTRESKEPEYEGEENVDSESGEEITQDIVRASKEQNSEEEENEEYPDKEEKSVSYENDLEEVEKSVSYDYKPEEADEEQEISSVKSSEDTGISEQNDKDAYVNILKEKYNHEAEGGENIFQDQIRPIEKNYIIKGVKKSKEEKEAILKALLHVDGPNEELKKDEIADLTEAPEIVELTTIKTTEEKDDDSFKTLLNHLSNGHMDEKDLKEVKNLDEAKIDSLVGEMQKKDQKPSTTSCDKQLKLCQIACGCNGTDATTEMDKYDIIKGFLGWIKSVQIDNMVPISV